MAKVMSLTFSNVRDLGWLLQKAMHFEWIKSSSKAHLWTKKSSFDCARNQIESKSTHPSPLQAKETAKYVPKRNLSFDSLFKFWNKKKSKRNDCNKKKEKKKIKPKKKVCKKKKRCQTALKTQCLEPKKKKKSKKASDKKKDHTSKKDDSCKEKKTDPCKEKKKEDPCKEKKKEDPCKEKKKEDPCKEKKKEDPCKEKKNEDPCKKKKKEDPCKKKKEDPCKKKKEDPCKKKKEDPCKKKKEDPCKKKKEDPCKKKKKDPCKKKKEDPCKKKKKEDPCKKKKEDPCKKKKEDPCKKKKEDPCKKKKEDPCKKKKEDPCKKKKEDPCKKKKEDPCKKKKEDPCKKKKEDPCKKKKEDPCKKKKKEDPCKKKKEDPCKKKKKEDPCKKKKEDPCKKKKEDPCKKKKEDPCKKKKEDPCKKKKEDPCKKKKEDPCKKKKEDPCKKKKDDPCKKKKEDPCKKKKVDPCKKKEKKKVDPCKKKVDPCKIGQKKKVDPCKIGQKKKVDPCKIGEKKKVDPCKIGEKKKDPCNKMKKVDHKIEPIKNVTMMDICKSLRRHGETLYKKTMLLDVLGKSSVGKNQGQQVLKYIEDKNKKPPLWSVSQPWGFLNVLLERVVNTIFVLPLASNKLLISLDLLQTPNKNKIIGTNNSSEDMCMSYLENCKESRIQREQKLKEHHDPLKLPPLAELWRNGDTYCPLYNECLKRMKYLYTYRPGDDQNIKNVFIPGLKLKNKFQHCQQPTYLCCRKGESSAVDSLLGSLRGKLWTSGESLNTTIFEGQQLSDFDNCNEATIQKKQKIKKCYDPIKPSVMDESWHSGSRYWPYHNECHKGIKHPSSYRSGDDPNSNKMLIAGLQIDNEIKKPHEQTGERECKKEENNAADSLFQNELWDSDKTHIILFENKPLSDHDSCNQSTIQKNQKLKKCYDPIKPSAMDELWHNGGPYWPFYSECHKRRKRPNTYRPGDDPNSNNLLITGLQITNEVRKFNGNEQAIEIESGKEENSAVDSLLSINLQKNNKELLISNIALFEDKHLSDYDSCNQGTIKKKGKIKKCYDPIKPSAMDELWHDGGPYWPFYSECHKRMKHPNSYRPGDDPNSNNLLIAGLQINNEFNKLHEEPVEAVFQKEKHYSTDFLIGSLKSKNWASDNSLISNIALFDDKPSSDHDSCNQSTIKKKGKIKKCYDPIKPSAMDELWHDGGPYWPFYSECHKRMKHPNSYRPGDDPNSNNLLIAGLQINNEFNKLHEEPVEAVFQKEKHYSTDFLIGSLKSKNWASDNSLISNITLFDDKPLSDHDSCNQSTIKKKGKIKKCYDPIKPSAMDKLWRSDGPYWPFHKECHKRRKRPNTYRPGDEPNSNNLLFNNNSTSGRRKTALLNSWFPMNLTNSDETGKTIDPLLKRSTSMFLAPNLVAVDKYKKLKLAETYTKKIGFSKENLMQSESMNNHWTNIFLYKDFKNQADNELVRRKESNNTCSYFHNLLCCFSLLIRNLV